MKKILVPTDFSENALKAALYAAEIAKRNNAEIFLLHVIQLGEEKIFQPFSLREKYNAVVEEDRKNDLAILKKALKSYFKGIKSETDLIEGDTVESILDFSQKNEIDFMVMGTGGAGLLKERLVGTVASGVVAKSKIPVLVVPEEYKIEEPDSILFATNHFEKDKNILNVIVEMAKLFSAAIHAVIFLDVDKAKAVDYMEGTRQVNQYLKYLLKTFPGINFTGEVIEGKDFESAIELYHATHATDMAAVITYPKGVWEKIFHRGVAKKMVFHSHIPVLVIPFKKIA